MNAERVLELAKKRSQEAEVYHRHAVSVPVLYDHSRLKSIRTVENTGVALRVTVDGRVGVSTSTRPGDEETLVDNAVAAARFGPEARFRFAPASRPPARDVFDPQVESLPLDRMVDLGNELVQSLAAVDHKIMASAGVEKETLAVRILTSQGFDGHYRKTFFGVSFGGELVEGENMLQAYRYAEGTRLNLEVAGVRQPVLEAFRLGRKNVPLASGSYPVLLTPFAVQDVLRCAVASLSGRAVEKGISPWKASRGNRVLHPSITIWDDGTMPEGAGSADFDDEGVPRQRTVLVEKGVLKDFYVDLQTAAALGAPPTGNGLKPGLEGTPVPSLTNLVLEPGDRPFHELLAGIKEGVLIDLLLGTFAGNPYGGVVSGNVMLGYKIEGGQLTGRVKNVMFSTNTFESLAKSLAGLSSEVEWVGNYRLPYVLLEDVHLASRS